MPPCPNGPAADKQSDIFSALFSITVDLKYHIRILWSFMLRVCLRRYPYGIGRDPLGLAHMHPVPVNIKGGFRWKILGSRQDISILIIDGPVMDRIGLQQGTMAAPEILCLGAPFFDRAGGKRKIIGHKSFCGIRLDISFVYS